MNANEPFTIEQFYKFLQQGRLLAGKCVKCGKIHLPPRPLCDNCYSQEFNWINVSGKGKLVTYTVISIAPQQFQDLVPYAIGIIQLESGLKIPGMIQAVKEEELRIGMSLALDFGSCTTIQEWPKWPRYCFKPLIE